MHVVRLLLKLRWEAAGSSRLLFLGLELTLKPHDPVFFPNQEGKHAEHHEGDDYFAEERIGSENEEKKDQIG